MFTATAKYMRSSRSRTKWTYSKKEGTFSSQQCASRVAPVAYGTRYSPLRRRHLGYLRNSSLFTPEPNFSYC